MALVIFDIDGTLFDTERVTVPAVQRTFAAFGLAVPDPELICSFCGRPIEEYYGWIEARCAPHSARKVIAAADTLELELIASEGRLYAGVADALDGLRTDGHTLAVCSNATEAYMREFLDALEIGRWVCEARCRGMRDIGKADMIRELMECCPARPVVMVGDRRDDVSAAHANGALAIAATYGFGANDEIEHADAEAASPSEIPKLVKRLIHRQTDPR